MMTCDFLTVFQSYQDDGRVIMKGCVQSNPVYSLLDFYPQVGLKPETTKSAVPTWLFPWHSHFLKIFKLSKNNDCLEYISNMSYDCVLPYFQDLISRNPGK